MLGALFRYPLLIRELTERAARRRTYIARVLFGVVLYTLFVLTLRRYTAAASSDPSGLSVLGFGRDLFRALIELQCWSILLLQPALMAGGITYEKERDSLSLLLLTPMSPTKMLLEKYLAGLLPMATLLLLALPAGAITMAYGGVSPQLLAAGAGVVIAAWLQTGAFALLCSAWCRTTVGAMLSAFLAGAAAHLAPAIFFSLRERYVLWGADLRGVDLPGWVWAAWPHESFARIIAFQDGAAASAGWAAMLGATWTHTLPLLASAAVCLLFARIVLVRRAERTGATAATVRRRGKLSLSIARALSHLRPARRDLPADDPVAWRESGRSVLGRRGRFWYLIVMCGGVTLALSVFLLGMYPKTDGPDRLQTLACVLGATAVLVLTVRAAGSVLSEHANQTLDILLTTSLGAPEILREKARALGRWWLLFALMLGIVLGLQGWSEHEYVRANMQWREIGQYWVCAALALLVYPPLVMWVSLALALWLRKQMRAVIAALVLFTVWFAGPLVALDFQHPDWRAHRGTLWLSLLSPLGILDANKHDLLPRFTVQETRAPGGARFIIRTAIGEPWAPVFFNFAGYALLGLAARWLCLRNADRWLRK